MSIRSASTQFDSLILILRRLSKPRQQPIHDNTRNIPQPLLQFLLIIDNPRRVLERKQRRDVHQNLQHSLVRFRGVEHEVEVLVHLIGSAIGEKGLAFLI